MRIVKIKEINKLGKFNECQNEIDFSQNNIIFGFNGMGKSTLSSIFYSMSGEGKSGILEARKTLKRKMDDPENEVKIIVETNEGDLLYENKHWSSYPLIYVFDSKYVNDHLFFDTENPKRLADETKIIEIGFGRKIVVLNNEKASILRDIETNYLPELQRIVNENYNECKVVYALGNTKKLSSDNGKIMDKLSAKLELYSVLEKDTVEKGIIENNEYDKQIKLLNENIDLLKGLYITNLNSFISPARINELLKKTPEPTADEIFEHMKKNHKRENLRWLIDGAYLASNSKVCPYCGQELNHSDSVKLIKSIQKFAYSKRTEKARGIQEDIKSYIERFAISDLIKSISQYSETVTKLYDNNLISANELKKYLPDELLINQVDEVLNNVMRKMWYKVEQVFQKVELDRSEIRMFQLIEILKKKCNMVIQLLEQNIASVNKKRLQDKDIQYKQAIYNMSFSGNRNDLLKISKLASKIIQKKHRLVEIEIEIMEENDNFQFNKINKVLKEMNIGCKLLKRKNKFYIKLEGYVEKSFEKGGDETVKYLLSEGENKALAFAYFLVELELYKNSDDRVIIIDDPICSMDMNRKSLVASKINMLMQDNNNQVMLLSHDISFIEKVDFFSSGKSKKLILGEHRLFDEFSINDYLMTDKEIYTKIINDVSDQDENSKILGLMSVMPLIEVSSINGISSAMKKKSTYFKHSIYATNKTGTEMFRPEEYTGISINQYLTDAETLLGQDIVGKYNIPLTFAFNGFGFQEAYNLYDSIHTDCIMDIRKKAMVLRVLAETVLYKMLNEQLDYKNIGKAYQKNIDTSNDDKRFYAQRLCEIYNQIKKYQHGAKGASTLGLAWINPKEIIFFDQEIKEIIEYLVGTNEEIRNLA